MLSNLLHPHELHIWVANLTITPEQAKQQAILLSSNEIIRAERLRFPIHKSRFIATRYMLRIILGDYLTLSPKNICFEYTKFNKPYLAHPNFSSLQFNLAHSENIAILGITLHDAIGVDIEKVQNNYPQKIAERYFHPEEYQNLNQLPDKDKATGFFRVWSRKEALIKAVGKGLSIPLSSFAVSIDDRSETIVIEDKSWTLAPLAIHPNYQAAVASNQSIKEIKIYQFVSPN